MSFIILNLLLAPHGVHCMKIAIEQFAEVAPAL